MTVYIDPIEDYEEDQIKQGARKYGKKWCHMVADTEQELHQMAAQLKLSRSWYQDRASMPHYDLTPMKAGRAVLLGAVTISTTEMVRRFSKTVKAWENRNSNPSV